VAALRNRTLVLRGVLHWESAARICAAAMAARERRLSGRL